MHKHEIRTTGDCLVYVTECNLATISHMMYLKSKSKNEFERQIAIAQIGIDHIRGFATEKHLRSLRVGDVLTKADGIVQKWVDLKLD